ncbi:50S ribosomal protein L20, partial [Striga asiatica]
MTKSLIIRKPFSSTFALFTSIYSVLKDQGVVQTFCNLFHHLYPLSRMKPLLPQVVVKNGRITKIWSDPWIPDAVAGFPQKTERGVREVYWVSELIDDDGRHWNREK